MFPFSGPGAASWKNHRISLPQSSSQWGDLGPFPPVVSGTWLSPLGASADGRSCGPCLCGWLLSKSACWEAGELRRNKGALIKPCEVSPCCLRTFLAGYFPFQQEIGSLAETGVLL